MVYGFCHVMAFPIVPWQNPWMQWNVVSMGFAIAHWSMHIFALLFFIQIFNLHRNTPSLLFWSLILSLLLHPLCACLQMGYFLLSCCKQCASGLQLCQVNWHLKSLLQSAQGLTLVFASIPLIWSKLRQQNQSPPCRFACKNTCLVCNIITSNILNILNTHNFPKKNLNLSTGMSFSQALVSLFVLLCSGPGLDSISPQRSKWQGKECWLTTDDQDFCLFQTWSWESCSAFQTRPSLSRRAAKQWPRAILHSPQIDFCMEMNELLYSWHTCQEEKTSPSSSGSHLFLLFCFFLQALE